MSTLGDAVTARDTAGRLINLTNLATSAGRAATTINDTTLQAAVADTEAAFARLAGTTFYLSTDVAVRARQLQICVPGVWAFLHLWKGQEGAQAAMDRFEKDCADYRSIGPNARITPVTDRSVGPSPDVDGSGAGRRPEFDRPRFDRMNVLVPPGNNDTGNEP